MSLSPARLAARLPVLAAGLTALTPALAGSGRLGGGAPLEVSLGRIIGALVVCIVVAGFAALLIRQRGGSAPLPSFLGRAAFRGRAIDVVESRRISQHADVCLLRHDGREYLLLLLAGDARILSEKAFADGAGAGGES